MDNAFLYLYSVQSISTFNKFFSDFLVNPTQSCTIMGDDNCLSGEIDQPNSSKEEVGYSYILINDVVDVHWSDLS